MPQVKHAARSVAGRRRTYRYLGGPARNVADVMTWPAVVVHGDTPASVAQRTAEEQGIHHLPVVERDRLAGMLCLCDLADAPIARRVHDLMHLRVASVPITAPLEVATLLMTGRRVGCLPVVATGFVCGIISHGDLIRAGIVPEHERPRCAACGSHHHLVGRAPAAPFCRECLERGHPSDEHDPYEELGLGD